jgi:dinuclear metal center YbgI/SA1388 family protein
VPKLSTLVSHFEKFWPTAHAEPWDNVGLVVGDTAVEVSKILVAVDLTHSVIDEAEAAGAQLILTHHPVLYKPLSTLAESQLKGSLISRLIRLGIFVYSAHTNADVQADGSSSLMALAFGATNLTPLVTTAQGFGHGCLGELKQPISLADFAKTVSLALPSTARGISIAGDLGQQIETIAVCGGAGDSFLPDVLASRADVYVTSDLRHHAALDALETPRVKPLALIDVSHFAAESLWLVAAAERVSGVSELQVIVSKTKTDVWEKVILDA